MYFSEQSVRSAQLYSKRYSNFDELKFRLPEKHLLKATGKDSYSTHPCSTDPCSLDNFSNLDLKILKLLSSVFGLKFYLILLLLNIAEIHCKFLGLSSIFYYHSIWNSLAKFSCPQNTLD